jgi:hypothetical protein
MFCVLAKFKILFYSPKTFRVKPKSLDNSDEYKSSMLTKSPGSISPSNGEVFRSIMMDSS